jgi:hypothetical protein
VTRRKDKVTALGSLQFPRIYHTHTHSLLAIYQCRSSGVVWWKVTKVISTVGLPVHLPHIPLCVCVCVCVCKICDEISCSISLGFSPFTPIAKPSFRLDHKHLTVYNRNVPKFHFFFLLAFTYAY